MRRADLVFSVRHGSFFFYRLPTFASEGTTRTSQSRTFSYGSSAVLFWLMGWTKAV